MKHNRFFIINHELSRNTNDQVFYYTRIVLKSDDGDKESMGNLYYPFYLTFKPFQVDFNYYGPNPDVKPKEAGFAELVHKTIFSLPLSFDYTVNDRLTDRLIELYDEESSFDNHYEYNHDFDFRKEKEAPSDTKSPEKHVFSYNRHYDIDSDCYNLPFRSAPVNRIRHRTILLDFLFDFNEVKKKYNDFSYCSFFDEVETRLRQNDFFNALATKYSYYYNHERLIETAIENHGQDSLISFQKKIQKFDSEFQQEAFRNNLLTLLPEFSPVTSFEVMQVNKLLKKNRIGFCFDDISAYFEGQYWSTPGEKNTILDNFVSEYRRNLIQENARIHVELRKYADVKDKWIRILEKTSSSAFILPKYKWWKHFETELENVYFERNGTSRINVLNKDEYNRIETAKWYSNRYDIIKSILLILNHPFGRKHKAQRTINFEIGSLILVYFSLVAIITLLLKSIAPQEIISLSAWIVYFSFSNTAIIILFTAYFFIKGIVNHAIHKKSDHYKLSIRSAGFFLPGLLMAIVSGWLFLALTGEELWKFELDMRFKTILIISGGALLIMILFLYLEVWKVNPKSWRSALSRALTIIYIGLMYSFIVGFFIMLFTSRKIIERSDLLEKFAYNVIASSDSIPRSAKEIEIKDYPRYVDNDKNNLYHFTSVSKFKQWVSDSLYFKNFIKNDLSTIGQEKWNLALKEQHLLVSYLYKAEKENPDEIFIDSLINLIYSTNEGKISLFLDESISLESKYDSGTVLLHVNKILNLRKEAIQEIGNNLVDFNYSKPLIDDYLYVDFLSNVQHDSDMNIPIVQMIHVPFYHDKEDVGIAIFPGYLVLNSFLALFVGVFLQMMFDKKKIAEPL